MATRRQFDVSPLASQICAGHYRQANKGVTRRPRGLPDWGLVYTLAGAGRFVVPDKTAVPLLTRPGLLLLAPPGTAHVIGAAPGRSWDHLWLHFLARPRWTEWLDWPGHPTGARTLFLPTGPARVKVVSLFRRIIRFTMAPDADRELFALNALEELLLWCRRVKPRPGAPSRDPLVQVCLDYITQQLKSVITLADLARISGQSVSRLTHRFRQQTGLSPMQYLEQRRLERAMELLGRTAMSVQNIAEAVGYANPFYFTLRFRKQTGYSPRTFRKRTTHATTILRRSDLPLNPNDREI